MESNSIPVDKFNQAFGGVVRRQGWRIEGDRMKAIYEDVAYNFELDDLLMVCERLRREDRFSYPRFMDMMNEVRDMRRNREFQDINREREWKIRAQGVECTRPVQARNCKACDIQNCVNIGRLMLEVIKEAITGDAVEAYTRYHKEYPNVGFDAHLRETIEYRKRPPAHEVKPGWQELREQRELLREVE